MWLYSATVSNNVTTSTESGVQVVTLRSGDARASVVPAWGGNCVDWRGGRPYLEDLPLSDIAAKPTSFGIPILIPFPNRLRNSAFDFGGERFEVTPNRHGFVRDKAWKLVDSGAGDDGAWVTCEIDARDHAEAILSQFPFPFRIRATYRLDGASLAMHTAVDNLGERPMPLGFGTHPYFHKPSRGTLEVPANQRWELSDSLPTGDRVEVSGAYDLREPRNLDELSLDDIYTDLIPDEDGRVRCAISDDEHGIRTIIEIDPAQFPHIVVYTPGAPRAAICVEPYTCPTDAFNLDARGIAADTITVAPGETRDFDIWMRVEST